MPNIIFFILLLSTTLRAFESSHVLIDKSSFLNAYILTEDQTTKWVKLKSDLYPVDHNDNSNSKDIPILVDRQHIQFISPSVQLKAKQVKVFIPKQYAKPYTPTKVIQKTVTAKTNACPCPPQSISNPCDILNQVEIKTPQLELCLESLKAKLTRNISYKEASKNQEVIFERIFELLTTVERDFLALILTAQGEAGVLAQNGLHRQKNPYGDLQMIMKVLENRKRIVQERGLQVELIDVALQPSQFSAFNRHEPVWKNLLYAPSGLSITQKTLEAYLRYPQVQWQGRPKTLINAVTHYHRDDEKGVRAWTKEAQLVEPRPNNEPLSGRQYNGEKCQGSNNKPCRHKFWAHVKWSFRPHPYKNWD